MKVFRNSIAVAVLTTIILAIFGLVVSASTSAKTALRDVKYDRLTSGVYNFDPAHTVIGFSVRHLGIALVEGRFKEIQGSVNYDADDVLKSTVEFSAKVDSIDTGVEARDTHLRSADFFEVEKYPQLNFKSTKLERKNGRLVLTGDLTIKGITKRVTFPFSMTGGIEDPWGGTRFGIAAGTTVNRRDFGINFGTLMRSGALDVANEVAVELHIEAVKAAK